MKRLCAAFLAAFLCLGAAAQEIRDIDIEVRLAQDGSAWITQHWDVTVVRGTEWYIPIENLGPMTVESLSVSENGKAFESVGDRWDVDWSASRKTGKCGIVRKKDGLELCWGQGEYGRHQWTARFHVTGLVQALDDADAFNFMFVNPGLVAPPQHVRVTISPDFVTETWTTENTRVWGFGFYGDINVKDGKVVAESSEPFESQSRLIAVVKFNKGIFQPTVQRGGVFQALLDKALEGSSYAEDDDDGVLFLLLFAILFLALFFLLLYVAIAAILGYKYKKSLFGKTKITEWYRDVPVEGNLFAAYYVLAKGGRFSIDAPSNQLIGAFFLRWILDGRLTVQPDPKSSKRVNLVFVQQENLFEDEVEQSLFEYARMASGDNQILENKEFEKWSEKNYQKVTKWPERALSTGKKWFSNHNYFQKGTTTTPEGATQACHVIEFRNFLKDFTLSAERGAVEVGLWKEYLVFAQLFGIADKVAAQFKKLYPADFERLTQQTGVNASYLRTAINFSNSISTHALTSAMAKASGGSGSIGGFGGHTSFGGGGGFSGGGFGGGSR